MASINEHTINGAEIIIIPHLKCPCGSVYTLPTILQYVSSFFSAQKRLDFYIKRAMIFAAGHVAQELLTPKNVKKENRQGMGWYAWHDTNHDRIRMEEILKKMEEPSLKILCPPKEQDIFLKIKALFSIPENKKTLRKIARALVHECHKTGRLEEEEIKKILRSK
jgi:hypothetical protein